MTCATMSGLKPAFRSCRVYFQVWRAQHSSVVTGTMGNSQPPVMLDCAMPRLTNRLLRKWLGVSLHYALWKRPGVSLHGSGWASLVRAKSSEIYFVSGSER